MLTHPDTWPRHILNLHMLYLLRPIFFPNVSFFSDYALGKSIDHFSNLLTCVFAVCLLVSFDSSNLRGMLLIKLNLYLYLPSQFIIMTFCRMVVFENKKMQDRDWKQKQKYRGMFETQKSGEKTSSGEIGLNIRTPACPKVGQDQVSGGVRQKRSTEGCSKFKSKRPLLDLCIWTKTFHYLC